MIPFLELQSQFRAIELEIRAAMDRVLVRAWYVLGDECTTFEQEFAAYLSASHAVGVGSGTDAIQLALQALGVGPGDEVITAANTCVPTACGIAATGARLRLADVSPDTLTLDPKSVEQSMTPKTKAIVPVHLYGNPCDMAPLLDVAQRHDLFVVEDCAQAHGASYKGQCCGTFGQAAAFSFYPSKNLGAYGDGGAVVTSDPDAAESVRKLRNYGQEQRYVHTTSGTNSRLDELQAAVLRTKLPHLDQWNAKRRDLAKRYDDAIEGLPLKRPLLVRDGESAHHLYVVRCAQRDALQQHLAGKGVGTLIHYPIAVHLQPAYADLGYADGDFPQSEAACSEVLSLPLYPELPDDALKTVCEALRSFDFEGQGSS